MTDAFPPRSLGALLDHAPRPLQFGTSGRRGDVRDLTQLEIYLNVRAELDYLLELPLTEGGIRRGQAFYLAHDLRPSSTHYVDTQGGRGELAQAVARAVEDSGLTPINLGEIPTPALMAHALADRCGSIMVTGSHIPFERNGYKTNSARGELRKQDEAPIDARVTAWRRRLLDEPDDISIFAADGRFKDGHRELPAASAAGRAGYLRRYRDFFGPSSLQGLRVLVYQHSAVGRDLLVEMLRELGAVAVPVGRSATFVPIDTEAIDDETLTRLDALATAATATGDRFDALVSTDGDSDRPLLIGLDDAADGSPRARFFGGDLVGMIVASWLQADAVVVPISCNDAIDRSPLAAVLEPKTRIGSPYVIAGMEAALDKGRQRVCGWEANGGFLLGSDLERGGRRLGALPTRDAFLPIACVLAEMAATRRSMSQVFDALPRRFSRAGLLRRFPRTQSLQIIAALAGLDPASPALVRDFPDTEGYGRVHRIDLTDGARFYFDNGDVAHVRPSGNADELRLYAVADTQARADEIVRLAIAEPAGTLRRLAAAYARTA